MLFLDVCTSIELHELCMYFEKVLHTTLLHVCIQHHFSKDAITLLLLALQDCQPEIFNINTTSQDLYGYTCLHMAIAAKRVDLIELLIMHQANPYVVDNSGKNASALAKHLQYEDIAMLLENYE